ncbi:MAG: hypothetical protein FWG87_07650 [Defluviitaleaceae bacterium]|nr:hypothetical protein [Defluviitaleaceae bacterium]
MSAPRLARTKLMGRCPSCGFRDFCVPSTYYVRTSGRTSPPPTKTKTRTLSVGGGQAGSKVLSKWFS